LSVFLGCHITASQREVPEFRDSLEKYIVKNRTIHRRI
jgi:hypothetical protein